MTCNDISNSLFLYVEMILLLMGKNAMIANRVSVVSHFAVLVVVLNSTNIENIVTSKKKKRKKNEICIFLDIFNEII